MRYRTNSSQSNFVSERRQAGFTLVEILLALSLFMVLLAVIFVPLNNAFQIFNAGRTSVALQGAADATVKNIAAELQGAIAVFPNDELPGVTDRAPYLNPLYATTPANACPGSACKNAPYFYSTGLDNTKRVGNTSRIDFILPARDSEGKVANPLKPLNYLVTYYARRFDANAATPSSFDRFSNPIGLYRAQMPYNDGTNVKLDTTNTRYGATSFGLGNSQWLLQSTASADVSPAEPKFYTPTLLPDDRGTTPGGDTLVSPRDMGLSIVDTTTMQPDVTFQCEDTDANGIIDRVTISLTLIQYEEGNSGTNGNPAGQRVTATQVVNLLNTKFGV